MRCWVRAVDVAFDSCAQAMYGDVVAVYARRQSADVSETTVTHEQATAPRAPWRLHFATSRHQALAVEAAIDDILGHVRTVG